MKLTLVFLAVLAVSGRFLAVNGSPVSTYAKTIQEHVEDFMRLLPMEKIRDLFNEYAAEDEDFAIVIDYLLGDEFKGEVTKFEATQEFKAFLNFLEKAGVPAYDVVNKFNELLGVNKISPLRRLPSSRATGGLAGFFKDLKALLPLDEIKKMHEEKLATAPEFKELFERLRSQEAYDLFAKVMADPTLKGLFQKAEARGADIDAILDLISSIFGVRIPPRPAAYAYGELADHLYDFIKLLPLDKFEALFDEYAANDEDFAAVLDYIRGDKFKAELTAIEHSAEFRAQVDFFESFGLPAYEMVNEFNALLGIYPVPAPRLMADRITGGMSGFFRDLKAFVPVETVQKLFREKRAKFSEFDEFVRKIESDDYYRQISSLIRKPDVQELIHKAEARGVNFRAILDFIGTIFGFHFPRP